MRIGPRKPACSEKQDSEMTAMGRSQAALTFGSNLSSFDVGRVRADFPILSKRIYDRPLVFLDSAASAQKPQAVIDAVRRCYEDEYANIHRGVYYLSAQATRAYED